jgi:Rap1a immunity proteins
MKLDRAILVVLFAFMVCGAAVAASMSTNPNSVTRLYGFCRSPYPGFMSRCAGYIQGFSKMMIIVGQASTDPGLPPDRRDALRAYGMCSQEAVPVAEMMRAFVNWTERNPQEWESNGEVGVLASLREAWPCT